MIESSRSRNGIQCAISGARGSRLLGGRAFTTLVIQTSSRETPAAASSSSSNRPARPTNGRPSVSSVAPGASPTKTTGADGFPSPGTQRDAVSHGSNPQPPCARISSLSPPSVSGLPTGRARGAWTTAACAGPPRRAPRPSWSRSQPGGDLLVEVAARDVAQDLALAGGELLELGVDLDGGDRGEGVEHEAGEPGREDRVPVGDPPHRVRELLPGDRLGD